MAVSAFKLILLLAMFFVNLCWAEDVTVYLNDTSLTTEPPNWWGRPEYSTLCGGSRWTNLLGQSVSLAFTGTAVTVNFILEYAGTIAQVALDGRDVTQVNTFVLGQPDTACNPYAWRSGNLSDGPHTITITQLGSGNPANPSNVFVWLHSFVYTASQNLSSVNAIPASTASTAITTMSAVPAQAEPKKSSNVGGIVGIVLGIVAVLLLFVGVLYLSRQQRWRSHQSSPQLLIDGQQLARA